MRGSSSVTGGSGSVTTTTGAGGSSSVTSGSGGTTVTGAGGRRRSSSTGHALGRPLSWSLAFYMAAAPHVDSVYMFDKDQKQLYVTSNDRTAWTALAKTTTDGKAVECSMTRSPRSRRHDRRHLLGRRYLRHRASTTRKTAERRSSSTCFTHTQTDRSTRPIARQTILAEPITAARSS